VNEKLTLKRVVDFVKDKGDENLRDINRKLQRVLEETLTKNMHLQRVNVYLLFSLLSSDACFVLYKQISVFILLFQLSFISYTARIQYMVIDLCCVKMLKMSNCLPADSPNHPRFFILCTKCCGKILTASHSVSALSID